MMQFLLLWSPFDGPTHRDWYYQPAAHLSARNKRRFFPISAYAISVPDADNISGCDSTNDERTTCGDSSGFRTRIWTHVGFTKMVFRL
jgi:hypothetical protein